MCRLSFKEWGRIMRRKSGIILRRQWLWNDQERGLVGGDVVVLSVSALI